MGKKANGLATSAAALALVSGFSMITASPAQAASASCHVVTDHCETNILAANSAPTGHYIGYTVNSRRSPYGCSWRVKDVNSGANVGYGRIGAFSLKSGTITGLYGFYRLELYDCGTGATGAIRNS